MLLTWRLVQMSETHASACEFARHVLADFRVEARTLLLSRYREDAGIVLASDTDEQLLIHIPFQQGVRCLRTAIDHAGFLMCAVQTSGPLHC